MACCPSRLVLKMHFPFPKIKIEAVEFLVSFFHRFVLLFTGLFIDIIMGNFRQHRKIYFTSCLSWSNFEHEWKREERGAWREKFTGENCFPIDTVFLFFFRVDFVEFSTTHQSSWLSPLAAATINLDALKKNHFGMGSEKKTKIQLWIFQPKSLDVLCGVRE